MIGKRRDPLLCIGGLCNVGLPRRLYSIDIDSIRFSERKMAIAIIGFHDEGVDRLSWNRQELREVSTQRRMLSPLHNQRDALRLQLIISSRCSGLALRICSWFRPFCGSWWDPHRKYRVSATIVTKVETEDLQV